VPRQAPDFGLWALDCGLLAPRPLALPHSAFPDAVSVTVRHGLSRLSRVVSRVACKETPVNIGLSRWHGYFTLLCPLTRVSRFTFQTFVAPCCTSVAPL
jgi:hypothetical protein